MPRRRWPRGFLSKIDPAHLLKKEVHLKGSPFSLERLNEFRNRRSNNLVISKSVTDAVSSYFLGDRRLNKEERETVQRLARLAQDATVGWIERTGLIVPKGKIPLVSSFLKSCVHLPIIEDYLKGRGKKFDLGFCAPRVIEQMRNPTQSFESFLASLEKEVVQRSKSERKQRMESQSMQKAEMRKLASPFHEFLKTCLLTPVDRTRVFQEIRTKPFPKNFESAKKLAIGLHNRKLPELIRGRNLGGLMIVEQIQQLAISREARETVAFHVVQMIDRGEGKEAVLDYIRSFPGKKREGIAKSIVPEKKVAGPRREKPLVEKSGLKPVTPLVSQPPTPKVVVPKTLPEIVQFAVVERTVPRLAILEMKKMLQREKQNGVAGALAKQALRHIILAEFTKESKRWRANETDLRNRTTPNQFNPLFFEVVSELKREGWIESYSKGQRKEWLQLTAKGRTLFSKYPKS